jgi:hypothetical protein
MASQESLQRLVDRVRLRRWQGLPLEGARELHAAHGCRRARRRCTRGEAERPHEVRIAATTT